MWALSSHHYSAYSFKKHTVPNAKTLRSQRRSFVRRAKQMVSRSNRDVDKEWPASAVRTVARVQHSPGLNNYCNLLNNSFATNRCCSARSAPGGDTSGDSERGRGQQLYRRTSRGARRRTLPHQVHLAHRRASQRLHVDDELAEDLLPRFGCHGYPNALYMEGVFLFHNPTLTYGSGRSSNNTIARCHVKAPNVLMQQQGIPVCQKTY